MQAFNPDRRGASVATTQTGQGFSVLDTAFGQFEHAGGQVQTAVRKAGNLSMHLYEQAVDRMLSFELEMARRAEQQWLEAQAELLRDLTGSYTSAARSVLR
jgi:predicted MarR family transcription regulator